VKDVAVQATIWIVIALMGVLIFLIPFMRRIVAKKLATFQAIVIDKRISTTVAYTGVFIPIEEHFLVLDRGGEIKVSGRAFKELGIGDTVTVSEYSDGSLRWEPLELSSFL
jgi:hypothetical protein